MKFKSLPTQERLHYLLDYDADTGFFYWKNPTARQVKVGSRAGTTIGTGYIQIRVDGKVYVAHRLAWMYAYGCDPGRLNVDHRDHDRANNQIANLRLATHGQNGQNCPSIKGYYFNKSRNNWRAEITTNGVRVSLGYFKTPEEAHQAYVEAARIHHGEFCPH
jgi:hypothetical protein